ncbi:hypothetical protein [Bacillus cereus]|uniref:hypothetical protein n=1 Tax=Bacillus cereus TaxID=1396 RepID=UPI000BF7764A|nr:hypothetical protein [Bacillus cereus]PFN14862.1 hypothetical protein COJ72_14075 [Bacillus cereus]
MTLVNLETHRGERSVETWYVTDKDTYQTCENTDFKHQSRYLKLLVSQYSEEGSESILAIFDDSDKMISDEFFSANTNRLNSETTEITIDLGEPTGNQQNVQLRFKSSIEGKKSRCRVLRMWLEG